MSRPIEVFLLFIPRPFNRSTTDLRASSLTSFIISF
jgi:hypothetical protein